MDFNRQLLKMCMDHGLIGDKRVRGYTPQRSKRWERLYMAYHQSEIGLKHPKTKAQLRKWLQNREQNVKKKQAALVAGTITPNDLDQIDLILIKAAQGSSEERAESMSDPLGESGAPKYRPILPKCEEGSVSVFRLPSNENKTAPQDNDDPLIDSKLFKKDSDQFSEMSYDLNDLSADVSHEMNVEDSPDADESAQLSVAQMPYVGMDDEVSRRVKKSTEHEKLRLVRLECSIAEERLQQERDRTKNVELEREVLAEKLKQEKIKTKLVALEYQRATEKMVSNILDEK